MRAGFDRLRQQIKTIELNTEQFQQNMLESITKTRPNERTINVQISAALHNLRCIVGTPKIHAAMADSLATLLLNSLDDDRAADLLMHQSIVTQFTTCESLPSA